MSDDEKKPPEPANSAARAGSKDTSNQPFQTAAAMLSIEPPKGERDPRLSQSPGLVKIEGSTVPGYGDGSPVNHVTGPGQAPVDPIAAGLDMQYDPKTRHEQRAPTMTGVIGAGNRPSTYAEKPGGLQIKQAADATNETIPPVVGKPGTPAALEGKPPEGPVTEPPKTTEL